MRTECLYIYSQIYRYREEGLNNYDIEDLDNV